MISDDSPGIVEADDQEVSNLVLQYLRLFIRTVEVDDLEATPLVEFPCPRVGAMAEPRPEYPAPPLRAVSSPDAEASEPFPPQRGSERDWDHAPDRQPDSSKSAPWTSQWPRPKASVPTAPLTTSGEGDWKVVGKEESKVGGTQQSVDVSTSDSRRDDASGPLLPGWIILHTLKRSSGSRK
ncbi:unnamed protein product [Acanthosepion pharaonis]|uniref:Uncharacterized protein n=1 Tax=Acanthosepion pharaonis TaxID=158019 RepID=A0A812DRD8_ACAPH|nr:unnamed protein product [Sepia pharaonis]